MQQSLLLEGVDVQHNSAGMRRIRQACTPGATVALQSDISGDSTGSPGNDRKESLMPKLGMMWQSQSTQRATADHFRL